MRIAFLAYGSLEQTTGGYIYDRHLVAGLRALGETVEVFALSPQDRAWPVGVDGFDVVLEDELIHPSLHRRGSRATAGGGSVPAPPVIVSLVHNLHCLQPATQARDLAEARERAYFGTVDAVVAVCADTLAGVRAVSGRSRLPAVVAHAGADHLGSALDEAAVRARAHESGPLRALFVGTVARHKGVHRLLGALAPLSRGTVALEVVGGGGDHDYLSFVRGEIERLDLRADVHLRGELRAGQVVERYRDSHVLVLPSDREAIPLVSLEALAFGLPLLLTNQGGPPEVLGTSAAGALLAPDDQRGWAETLRLFATDRTWLEGTAVAALARHRAWGTWSETAVAVRDFLRQLRGGGGGGGGAEA